MFLDIHTLEEYRNMDILPGPTAQQQLHENFKILVARSITNFLPALAILKGLIKKHITHVFSDKMAKKSEVVS